ncbi:hypothetical protein ACEUB2_14460 [Aeromonas veronii]
MNSTDVVTLFGDDKILSFDLELTRDEKLRHLGALLAGRELNLKGPQDLALKELNALAQGADVILGHNILDFDLPWLAKQAVRPQLLLEKPVIDTLYLSPLAFPKTPITAWSRITNWFGIPSMIRSRMQGSHCRFSRNS